MNEPTMRVVVKSGRKEISVYGISFAETFETYVLLHALNTVYTIKGKLISCRPSVFSFNTNTDEVLEAVGAKELTKNLREDEIFESGLHE